MHLPCQIGEEDVWIVGLIVLVGEALATGWLVYLCSRGQIVITFDKGADLATLVLTAAILVVTGVAVMVGIVTVWGFREIRDRAVTAAVNAAMRAISGSERGGFGAAQDSPAGTEANEIAQAMDDGEAS
jgi:hypothetical protein